MRANGVARVAARGVWPEGTSQTMGSIGLYIFRTTFGAFLVVLFSLTSVIWITQALRDIDLMTGRGQTILVFLGITGLIVPMLILVIAPIALMIAVVHVLGKLSNDSELIVMNASGMSPWVMFRPFLFMAIMVAAIVATIGAWLGPLGLTTLHAWANEVRADLVTNIVQPGRFNAFERGLTFHIRERQANGVLLGILVDDRRNPKERSTFLAEQGHILKDERGTFLVLENGSVQRMDMTDREPGKERDPAIVLYDRYALDLSQAPSSTQVGGRNSSRDRYIWQLIWPSEEDVKKLPRGQMHAELHDRLLAPLYPIVFVTLTFAYLGAPRTTRQSRAMSLAGAISVVAVLRLFGFVAIVLSVNYPSAPYFQYAVLALAMAFGLYAIDRGLIIEPPAAVTNAINALTQRFARRTAAA
jgi:lipopolysaccharide export system permease protein